MTKKHLYKIIINNEPVKGNCFTYKYGNTKNILMKVSKQSVCLQFEMTPLYSKEKLISSENDIFSDGLKKAMFVHLILYGKNLNYSTVTTMIDDESTMITLEEKLIYSMIEDNGTIGIPASWKNATFIEKILNCSFNSKEAKLASLFSLLYAKNQKYRFSKFVNLWMSFNGFYNATYAKNHDGSLYYTDSKGKKVKSNDNNRIKNLLQTYEYGNEILTIKQRDKVGYKVIGCLKEWDEELVTKESLETGTHKKVAEAIERQIREVNSSIDISIYGYLLCDLCYFFRCHYIHATDPMKLFSFSEDNDLKNLKLANCLLEHFLENHIIDIF